MAASRFFTSLILAAGLAGVCAQSTTSYTDAATGISFQQYTNAAGFSFGIALPEKSSTDFIGQISASTTGWAAVTLTGSMRNSVLVVAWPTDEDVRGSLRTTTGYSTPDLLGGDAILKPIKDGISVNSTGFTYTFLCEGCIVSGKAFDPTAESGVLGWALSTSAVTSPSDTSTTLQYHDGGFGGFGFDVTGAKSTDFASWAALASEGNATVPTPGGNNGTTPVTPPTNGTVPISNSTYDYIVVGGGASGLVVSQRLAETGKSVLVLERGGPSFYATGGDAVVPWNDTLTAYEVPALFMSLFSLPGVADSYCSDTPQIAGCVLGGGTAVNGLQFVRPPSSDFENWPTGWNWDEVEASAARVYERNPGSLNPSTDGEYYDDAVFEVLSKFLQGAGWKYADTNEQPDEKVQVFSHPAINTIDGLRAGPVRTYLPLAESLPNFKLQLHTKVIRAVRTNATITGVEIEDGQGQHSIINVNHGGKVILAAGAMSSPRLLFNSGIGPAEQINIVKSGSTGVTLPPESAWINSPVGFVRDHSFISVNFKVNAGMNVLPQSALANPSEEMIDLYANGAGPLAQGFFRAMTYTTITNADGHKTRIQTHCASAANDTLTVMFFITHGLTSSGMLGITPEGNTEWTVSPYLNSASDKEAMAAAIEEFLAISRQANSTLTYIGSANATGASIVASSIPQAGVHMTGTTIMGIDDGSKNGSSVVDPNCKVYGTDNLFVVDAGMHADVPTGNTQAIVMVAAEHAAAKIIALASGAATVPVNETVASPVRASTGTTAPLSIATSSPTTVRSVKPSRTPYRR
ncbi:Nn.00g039280.m01.CDS01 [Neocucurbitaria sp. VM-36]